MNSERTYHTISDQREFPDEHIMAIFKEPWYADLVNYLATGQIPAEWTKQDQCRLFPKYGTSSEKSRIFLSITRLDYSTMHTRGRTEECA